MTTNEKQNKSPGGNQVAEQIGALKQLAKNLKQPTDGEDIDPEEVGKWITVIGKALLAVFK